MILLIIHSFVLAFLFESEIRFVFTAFDFDVVPDDVVLGAVGHSAAAGQGLLQLNFIDRIIEILADVEDVPP